MKRQSAIAKNAAEPVNTAAMFVVAWAKSSLQIQIAKRRSANARTPPLPAAVDCRAKLDACFVVTDSARADKKGPTMNDRNEDLNQPDEGDLLRDEVSDEAVEAAASAATGGLPTLWYSTHCFGCPSLSPLGRQVAQQG